MISLSRERPIRIWPGLRGCTRRRSRTIALCAVTGSIDRPPDAPDTAPAGPGGLPRHSPADRRRRDRRGCEGPEVLDGDGRRVRPARRSRRRDGRPDRSGQEHHLRAIGGAETQPQLADDVDVAQPPAVAPQPVGADVLHPPADRRGAQHQMPARHPPVVDHNIRGPGPPHHDRSVAGERHLPRRGVDAQSSPSHQRSPSIARRTIVCPREGHFPASFRDMSESRPSSVRGRLRCRASHGRKVPTPPPPSLQEVNE